MSPPTRHRDRKLNDVSQEGNDVCGVDDWRCWCGAGGDGEALIRRGGSQIQDMLTMDYCQFSICRSLILSQCFPFVVQCFHLSHSVSCLVLLFLRCFSFVRKVFLTHNVTLSETEDEERAGVLREIPKGQLCDFYPEKNTYARDEI